MNEAAIKAHAEARANGQAEGDRPTEADFVQAEKEVRKMLADGAWYDPETGWTWPEPDGAPCCPDPGCPGRGGGECEFPGYAENH